MCEHGELAPLLNRLQAECDRTPTRIRRPNCTPAQTKMLKDKISSATAERTIQNSDSDEGLLDWNKQSIPTPKHKTRKAYVHLRSWLQKQESRGFVFPQNTPRDLGMVPGKDNNELTLILLPLKIKLAKIDDRPDEKCTFTKHYQYAKGDTVPDSSDTRTHLLPPPPKTLQSARMEPHLKPRAKQQRVRALIQKRTENREE